MTLVQISTHSSMTLVQPLPRHNTVFIEFAAVIVPVHTGMLLLPMGHTYYYRIGYLSGVSVVSWHVWVLFCVNMNGLSTTWCAVDGACTKYTTTVTHRMPPRQLSCLSSSIAKSCGFKSWIAPTETWLYFCVLLSCCTVRGLPSS